MLAVVTALYGALTALLMIVTALGVVRVRRKEKIALGDGGSPQVTQAMRIHANLAEYAPISLLLLLFLELNQGASALLHAFGIAFLVGRVLHVWGFRASQATRTGATTAP